MNPHLPSGAKCPAPESADVMSRMVENYDAYFQCADYQRRYPRPNRTTMQALQRCGVAMAQSVLDFGCGTGRYVLPLLGQTAARITAFDIAPSAIGELRRALAGTPGAERVRLVCGDAAQLDGSGPYDLVLLLFGVLSHVGTREQRLRTLRQMRRLVAPDGRLVLSVPNILRRRPLSLLRTVLSRPRRAVDPLLAEPGNIIFLRHVAAADRAFFYHLYSSRSIAEELGCCGFAAERVEAESLLPEWAVTQSEALGRLDAAVLRGLPAACGYCIRVIARPV